MRQQWKSYHLISFDELGRLGRQAGDITSRPRQGSHQARPTGSASSVKTIGMNDVACFIAGVATPDDTMTSTLSRTTRQRLQRRFRSAPPPRRYTIVAVRPSIQPSSPRRWTKAAVHGPPPDAEVFPKNPMVGSLPFGCARVASGHAAAAPPRRAMISRRFTGTTPCFRAKDSTLGSAGDCCTAEFRWAYDRSGSIPLKKSPK